MSVVFVLLIRKWQGLSKMGGQFHHDEDIRAARARKREGRSRSGGSEAVRGRLEKASHAWLGQRLQGEWGTKPDSRSGKRMDFQEQ